jgi:hypothetical protein
MSMGEDSMQFLRNLYSTGSANAAAGSDTTAAGWQSGKLLKKCFSALGFCGATPPLRASGLNEPLAAEIDYITQLPACSDSEQRELIRPKLQQSLLDWGKNSLPNENRMEAAERIFKSFITKSACVNLSGLNLRSLPQEIGNLTQLKKLDLLANHLT